LIKQSIAKRYARGLFAVGEKDGKYKLYLEEIDRVLKLFDGKERLRKALMLPILEMEKRKELLADVMKLLDMSLPFANMLSMLLEKNRMGYLPLVKNVYGEFLDEKEGRVKGTIWSAYPLDESMKARIQDALKEKMKKEVVLEMIEDKTLIGGIKVVVKGTIIDGTVKKQLEVLKENILKE
jgi:F-type H+-transporting ATPase subunit delta